MCSIVMEFCEVTARLSTTERREIFTIHYRDSKFQSHEKMETKKERFTLKTEILKIQIKNFTLKFARSLLYYKIKSPYYLMPASLPF